LLWGFGGCRYIHPHLQCMALQWAGRASPVTRTVRKSKQRSCGKLT
jgi:hypothetical protein